MNALKWIRIAAWAAIAAIAIMAGLAALGLRPGQVDVAGLPMAAPIGGSFTLTDQHGRRFDSAALAGKPYAIFFGFTNCPDVCPTSLLEITNRLEELGPDAERMNVVFVSIDPEQDTPEHIKRYVANFDKRIIGLTGTAAEIADIARKFRVIYEKVPTKEGYTMNHTATVYLMNAAGRFAGTIAYQEPADSQRQKLKRLVSSR